MANSEYKPIESKMKKSVDALSSELATLRAGRANPAVLDKAKVDYYGVPTPINQVANISVPEARLIVIQPWDASLLKEIEKAIQASDIGINPNNDGKVIRLVFPNLTEERRKDLVKTVKEHGEETKVSIRAARRDGLDEYKEMEKSGDITEDDLRQTEDEIQELTDNYIEKVDKIVEDKKDEIMEV